MAFSFGFEEATKEVELEILHRAASEVSSSLFRHRQKTFEEAIDLALKDIATKYLTGIKDLDSIFKTLEIKSYFQSTMELLSQIFRMGRKLQSQDVEDFGEFLKNLWQEYNNRAPVAHLLSSLVGNTLTKPPNIRYLTGNVYDPQYRKYAFRKKYPNLNFYFDSYHKFQVLNEPQVDQEMLDGFITSFKTGMAQIQPEVIEFYASIFAGLTGIGTIQDVLDHLVLLVYIKLKSWVLKSNKDILSIFEGIFGTEETSRLELKYSGLSNENDSIDTAINRLKKYLKYELNIVVPIETKIDDSEFTLEMAIEKIAELRNRKIVLDSALQKKAFVQGLTVDERNYFFRGLTGQDFHTYLQNMANRRNIDVNVMSLDTMAMEELFKRLFKTDANTMMFHALIENQPSTDAGAGTVAGRDVLFRYEGAMKYMLKIRGERVAESFDGGIKFKSLMRGLGENELEELSKILFNSPSATWQDCHVEFLKILDQKDKVKAGSDVSTLDDITEGSKIVKDFCYTLIKYSLSPALSSFDITIDIINWTRENVNDIFVSLDSEDAFQKNLGKMVIHSLVNEVQAIFPKMRENSHYIVAFLSAMITKEKIFSELLREIDEESRILHRYTQLPLKLPIDAQSWTVANEIWVRHLEREVKDVIIEKVIIQKLTPEEKARRAYQMAETAAMKYTLSLRLSKDGISCLSINQEEAFIEFLKFLRQHGVQELLATEFQLGDSLELGSIKLRDAVLQIMNEKYRDELEKVIVRMEHGARFDDDTILNFSSTIIDLLNYSIIRETEYMIESSYLDKVRAFASKYQSLFVANNFSSPILRAQSRKKIINEMGKDFADLVKQAKEIERYNYFQDMFSSVLELPVLEYVAQLTQIPEGTPEYDKNMQNFARYLYGKGVKRNSFTVLLNHLMNEAVKGSAEIGTDYWKRYADRCRYVLRRIDKTIQVLKK